MSEKYDSLGQKKLLLITGVAAFSAGMSTMGNTAGDTGLVSSQLVFVGQGAVSLSQTVVGGNATLSFSAPAQTNQSLGIYASSQTTGESSSSTVDARSLTFVGMGNISVGLTNGSILISGSGGGGGGALSALAAGTQTGSSGTILFADSNGISFGMSGSTRITASYTVPTQVSAFAQSNTTQSTSGTIALNSLQFNGAGIASVGVSNGSIVISATQSNQAASGSNGSFTFQTLSFSNANGISFGSSAGGAITASYTVPVVPAQFSAGLSNIGNTVGDTGAVTGRLIFAGGNNVTLSGSTNAGSMTITVSVPNGATATGNFGALAAGTQTATSGTVVFSDSNGLSFGMSGSTRITGSLYTVPSQISAFAQSNTTQSTSGTIPLNSIQFNGAGAVSVGVSNGSVVISGATQTNQLITFFAQGNTTQSSSGTRNASSIDFRGAGIVSVGVTAGSIVISATQSVQPGMSAGLTDSGNTLGDTGAVTGRLIFVGTNNITLSGSTNGGSMTISISGGAGGAGNTGFISAGGATASLGTVVFSDSNGLSFGVNGQTVTGSFARFVGGLSNIGNTAGDTVTVSRQIVFAGGNNVTLSGSSNGSSLTITISGPNTQSWFSQAGISNLGNTAGTSGMQGSRLVFAGGNNITLSQSTAAGGLGTITVSGPNTQNWFSQAGISNLGNTAGDTGMQNSRVVFVGGNNVTLSGATAGGGLGTITISVPNGATATGNLGAIAAGTQTATSGTIVFSDSNGISFGMSGSTRVTASYTVPGTLSAFAQSNTTQSSSGTIPFNSLQFQGAGIASVGVSNGSIVISVPAGGGGGDGVVSLGMSTQGNTAGTTGLVSSGRFIFVGTGPISLSQSLNGQSGTLSIDGPAVSSLVQAGLVSLSTNGSTITISASLPQYSQLWGIPPVATTANAQVGNGTIAVYPILREGAFSVSAAKVYGSISASSSSNSSHAGNLSFYIGIYTRNVSTLSLASSGSQSYQWSNTSNNSLSSITGLREFSIPIDINFTGGADVWIAVMSRSSTTNANWFTASNLLAKMAINDGLVVGSIGQVSSATRGILGFGRYSASSAALPNSMAFSHITGQGVTATLSKHFPNVQFYNFTA